MTAFRSLSLSALVLASAAAAPVFAQSAGPVSTTPVTGIANPTAPTALSPVGSPPSAIGSPVVPSGVGAPPVSASSTLPSPGATLPSATLANPNPSPGSLAASRSYADPGRAAGPLAVPDSLSAGGDLCPANLIRTAAGCVPLSQARQGDNLLYRKDFKR